MVCQLTSGDVETEFCDIVGAIRGTSDTLSEGGASALEQQSFAI